MTEMERNLGRRWFEEVWNKGRRGGIAEMLAPDAVLHDSERDSQPGPDGFYPFFDRLNATLSELYVTVQDSFAEGDRVCVRWECIAKHTGDGFGIPPTGKPIRVTGISILRVAGGMVVEAWQNWDVMGMMEQMQMNSPDESATLDHLAVGRSLRLG